MSRTDQNIIKGSKLMVFLGDSPIGFATSHSLSMTTATISVSTKDHGDYPSTIAQNITWEITAENLYSTTGESTYMTAMKTMQPVTVVFAEAGNYNNNTTAQPGIQGISTNGPSEWTLGDKIAEGKALITSFSINAPAGDNATMSVTFTGTGDLTTTFGATGATGATGAQG